MVIRGRMISVRPFFAIGLIAAIGCAGSSTTNGSGLPDAASTPPDGGTGSGSLAGTLKGKAFAPVSAFSYNNGSYIDLVFSNMPDVCASVTAGNVRAGEQLLQLLDLTRSGDGTYAPSLSPGDVKVAVFDADCHVSFRANAASNQAFTIQITRNDAQAVDGTATVTFDSGSKVSGSFSAPACAATLTEKDVCR